MDNTKESFPEKHSELITIPSYLIDCNRVLRPSALLGLVQEVAGNAAAEIGTGYSDMTAHGLAWIISRIHLDILKPAAWEQKVELQSWHKGLDLVFFRREYRMKDALTGEIMMNGTCEWLVLELEGRRLFRTDRLSNYFDITPQSDESAVKESAPKIRMPSNCAEEFIRSHEILYSDIDFNFHANNTDYLAWAMDCLPDELTLKSYPKSIDLNYNREIRPGEKVDLYRAITGNEAYVEGRIDGVSHFICKLVY